MTPQELCREATKRGLWLKPAGEKLAVFPKGKCTPEFAGVLRQHKTELLDWLEAKTAHLPPDHAPWLHIARQLLAGEFDDADRSTVESLAFGLRGVRHPRSQRALARLNSQAKGFS